MVDRGFSPFPFDPPPEEEIVLPDEEYTVAFRITNFGDIIPADGSLIVFPVDHTIGFDIAEVAITLLDNVFYVDPVLLASSSPPLPHAPTHEDGGSDEINVAGLSGLLADAQTPRATIVTLIALATAEAF